MEEDRRSVSWPSSDQAETFSETFSRRWDPDREGQNKILAEDGKAQRGRSAGCTGDCSQVKLHLEIYWMEWIISFDCFLKVLDEKIGEYRLWVELSLSLHDWAISCFTASDNIQFQITWLHLITSNIWPEPNFSCNKSLDFLKPKQTIRKNLHPESVKRSSENASTRSLRQRDLNWTFNSLALTFLTIREMDDACLSEVAKATSQPWIGRRKGLSVKLMFKSRYTMLSEYVSIQTLANFAFHSPPHHWFHHKLF